MPQFGEFITCIAYTDTQFGILYFHFRQIKINKQCYMGKPLLEATAAEQQQQRARY